VVGSAMGVLSAQISGISDVVYTSAFRHWHFEAGWNRKATSLGCGTAKHVSQKQNAEVRHTNQADTASQRG